MKVDGKWGLAWQTLYPAHKVVARRSVYVECEKSTPWPAPVKSFELVGVRRASFRAPGVGIVDGAAVASGSRSSGTGNATRSPSRTRSTSSR
jgi:hypothetical protein